MSATAEQPVNLKEHGWDFRKAEPEDFAEGEPVRRAWVYEHREWGLKTPVFDMPGHAVKAAHKLHEAHVSGQLGGEEPAPEETPESVPRPAHDDAYWHALADVELAAMGTVNKSRRESKKRVWRALSALAEAFAVGELPEALFRVAEKAQVMRLLATAEAPDPADPVMTKLMAEAGLDTAEKYAAARVALLNVVSEYGPTESPEAEEARAFDSPCPHDEDEGRQVDGEGTALHSPAEIEEIVEREAEHLEPGTDDASNDERADTAAAAPAFESEVTIVGRPGPALFDTAAPAPLALEMHPDRITRHPSLLMRAGGLDGDHVADLRDELRRGRRLPAVDVFFDASIKVHWLADGNHRHEAARLEGALLDINLHQGSLRDAILFAVRSNASHGLKRSTDDKRLAVVTLLADEEWATKSDTAVAELADVSQPFVGKVQGWLEKLVRLVNGSRAVGGRAESARTDASYAEETGAPDGLVRIVRALPEEQFERLAHNVIARATARTDSAGKQFSVERAPAEVAPTLFTGEEPAIVEESAPEPSAEAQEPAGEPAAVSGDAEAVPAPAAAVQTEGARPEVKVTDRRTAGSPPAAPPETQSPAQPARDSSVHAAPMPASADTQEAWRQADSPWGKATVQVSLKLFPDDGDPAGRRALLVINEEGGQPITTLFRGEEQMGRQVHAMAQRLRDEMPARAAATKTPAAKPATATKTAAKKTTAKSAKKGAAKKSPAKKGAKK